MPNWMQKEMCYKQPDEGIEEDKTGDLISIWTFLETESINWRTGRWGRSNDLKLNSGKLNLAIAKEIPHSLSK